MLGEALRRGEVRGTPIPWGGGRLAGAEPTALAPVTPLHSPEALVGVACTRVRDRECARARARPPAEGGLAAGDAGADAGAVAASVCSRGPTGAPAVGGRGGGGRAGGGSAGGAGGSPRASPRTSPRASPPAVASPHRAMVRLRPRSHSARGDFPGAPRVGSGVGGLRFLGRGGRRTVRVFLPPSLPRGRSRGRAPRGPRARRGSPVRTAGVRERLCRAPLALPSPPARPHPRPGLSAAARAA